MSKNIHITAEQGWEQLVSTLAQAQTGDTITLAAGQYNGSSSLIINCPLTLQGTDGVELIYKGFGAAILLENTREVSLIGLHISYQTSNSNSLENDGLNTCITVDLSQIVLIQSCSCQGNGVSHFGICFSSSIGEIKDNECWGNEGVGIVLQRDSGSPDQPSQATLQANRCHENKLFGIVFCSSNGEIKDNECWGNGGLASYYNALLIAQINPA